MNIEERIVKLEKSNRIYRTVLTIIVALFFIASKDIFIKDQIQVDTIHANEILTKNLIITNDINQKDSLNNQKKPTFIKIDSTLNCEYHYFSEDGYYHGLNRKIYHLFYK